MTTDILTDNGGVNGSDTFTCYICDVKCSNRSNYKRHILSAKHAKLTEYCNSTDKGRANGVKSFFCICGKTYKHRQSLFTHKKNCKAMNGNNLNYDIQEEDSSKFNDKDTIKMLVNQNQALMDILKKGTHNNTTNIANNQKTFNLQIFLNEDCKDAMNITDFVNRIELKLSDVERIGNEGYVNGLSNIIANELNSMEVTKRPIHCSDLKRETLYVKDADKWEKDTDKQKINTMVKKISDKNYFKLQDWKGANPGYDDASSKKSDTYNHIMYHSFDGTKENLTKVVKNIAKEVKIEK